MSGGPIIRHRALLPAAILALLILWAPWPFGSVTPWAAALLVVGGAAALITALPGREGAWPPVAAPALALALVAALGLLQSVPWPAELAGRISPEHGRLAAEAEAALDPSGGTAPDRVALSLAPTVTRRAALLFAGMAAVLAAAAGAGRRRLGRRIVGGAVLATALAQVLWGAPRWFVQARVLWGVEIPGSDRLRGTYVNPNHLAVLLEIALAVAFAWGCWAVSRARSERAPERRLALLAPPGAAWITLFVALAFTGSRAGLAAAVAATCVQGVLARHLVAPGRRRSGRLMLSGLLLALAGGAAVLWIGPSQGFGRWTGAQPQLGAQLRLEAYAQALELWTRFPWTGTGLGTFLHAFPAVQPGPQELTWWHAHSDPLELLVTAGVLGAVAFAAGAAFLAVRLLGLLRRGSRAEDRAGALAALGALGAVGLHETVDFGLTVAANAFILAAVAGVAAGARPARAGGGAPRTPRGSGAPGGADRR